MAQMALSLATLNPLNHLRCLRSLLDPHMYNLPNSRCRDPSSRLHLILSIMRTTSPNPKHIMRSLVPMRHHRPGTRSEVSTLRNNTLNSQCPINRLIDTLRRSTSRQWKWGSPTCHLHYRDQLLPGLRTLRL